MKHFIKLTQWGPRVKVFVNLRNVLYTEDAKSYNEVEYTKIHLVGQTEPLEVTEAPAEVRRQISLVDGQG